MNCKAYRDEIDAATLDGALSAPSERHLAACDACRAFRSERAALRHLVGGLASVAAPADFEFRLRARMRADGGGPRGGLGARVFRPLAAAVAACAAVAFTVAYLRLPSEAPRPSSASVTPSERQAAPAATTQAPGAHVAAQSASAKSADENGGGAREGKSGHALAEPDVVEASAPRRNQHARAVAQVRPAGRAKGQKAVEGMSDFALLPADVRTRRADASEEVAVGNPPVELSASRRPMRVVLRNEHGASRVVSMRPVSFGSQEFAGRLSNSFSASNSAKEVVW